MRDLEESIGHRRFAGVIPRVDSIGSTLSDAEPCRSAGRCTLFLGVCVIDSILCYKSFTILYAGYEAGFMFTPDELRQSDIFACLDKAKCARLAQIIADVRLAPGEWLFREGAPAAFYVLFEGSLRMVLDVYGKQTEFPEYELKQGEFLGEVPLLLGTPFFGSIRALSSCRIARLDRQQFFHMILRRSPGHDSTTDG